MHYGASEGAKKLSLDSGCKLPRLLCRDLGGYESEYGATGHERRVLVASSRGSSEFRAAVCWSLRAYSSPQERSRIARCLTSAPAWAWGSSRWPSGFSTGASTLVAVLRRFRLPAAQPRALLALGPGSQHAPGISETESKPHASLVNFSQIVPGAA